MTKFKKLVTVICIAVVGLTGCGKKEPINNDSVNNTINVTEIQDDSFSINGDIYEFDKKSEYEIDSSESTTSTDNCSTLGSLILNGNITRNYTNNGYTSYEIADDTVFSISYKYNNKLKNADSMDWHLIEDNKKVINGIELDNKIDYGALLFQTSLDGKKWITSSISTNLTDDISFNNDNGINNIQLANGCFYRIIVAYQLEMQKNKKKILFVNASDYEHKKIAEVYNFYASYKDIDNSPTGEKFYFTAGAKNADYTIKTKKNNYAKSEKVKLETKDPFFGWDLGKFCLSGYTDKGDDEDVYLKKVGNKVKLTFRLEQDIDNLQGNSNLIIGSDKNGSDQDFKIPKHDMKRGELIIKHTDDENKTTEVKYSDFLAALASPGADTSIQLFEEGDYEVALDYSITNKDGVDSTTYYKTTFSFKIRNANCMVYLFDSLTGAELSNGDVTENGFRVDSAKSSYPKLYVKKEILNNTESGLVEDTRFNGAAYDGEIYTDEGIYTIKAYNKYEEKLEPAVKTIYVGNNSILRAYIKHLNTSTPYEISELNDLVNEGYTITDNGDIIDPVIETQLVTSEKNTKASEKQPVTTYVTTVNMVTTHNSDDAKNVGNKKSAIPILGGIGIVAISGIATTAFKKKKK